jgi:hypothetical protein
MNTSTDIKQISAALVGFHKAVGKIPKDSNNPFFKSKYASLSGILDTIATPLADNGLSIVQFPEGENGLTTRLVHSSGEWMEATYSMRPAKDDPQGRGSAITYQRRYAVGAMLSLNIDEDDDANAASKLPQKQVQPKPQPAKEPVVTGEVGAELTKQISACKTEDDLKALYKLKKAEIDGNPAALAYLKMHKKVILESQNQTV